MAAFAGLVALLLGKPVRALVLATLGPVIVVGFAPLLAVAASVFGPQTTLLVVFIALSLVWPVAILYFVVASAVVVADATSSTAEPSVPLVPWLEEMRRQGSRSAPTSHSG
ncbi:MAG: hypothetical protein ABL883_14640 [Terricaulis sp.]